MKKLMIAFAVVACAMISQAYEFQWRLGAAAAKIYDQNDSTTVGNATIYLFNETDLSAASLISTLSGMEGSTAMTTYLANNALNSQSLSSGKFTTYADVSSIGTSSEGYWNNYAAVLTTDDDATYLYVTQVSKSQVPELTTETVQAQFGTQAASKSAAADYGTKYSGAGWYTVSSAAVPEPFSGALALLGMGAIALRRKMKKAKKA